MSAVCIGFRRCLPGARVSLMLFFWLVHKMYQSTSVGPLLDNFCKRTVTVTVTVVIL